MSRSPQQSSSDPGVVVRLAAVSEEPIDVAAVTALVEDQQAGAVVTFAGAVRNHDGGREVSSLSYSCHPSAPEVLRQVAEEFADREGVHAIAVVHRVGGLEIGDVALLAVVAASHRHQAFSCASDLVDRVKEQVPIWKHQRYPDGTADWTGLP
ncbi:molybdenum cofactor biosynthesis protein MoaE [Tessaracoccus sp. OS52]|uniref:molybdenum cofactor biosynthesis protein MoaE n=1 Tax=Tessaracoccus sp. OS52 TaxID=2886691 RepID=UPI001D0F8286|nr:molybdenum cofactor biosynthesis protein MoaE [Tessaracoccus sp. OS52]